MTEDLAKKRFFILSFCRLAGVGIAFFGVAVIAKRLIEPADIVGGVCILLGAFQVLVLPIVLVRAWRTPPSP